MRHTRTWLAGWLVLALAIPAWAQGGKNAEAALKDAFWQEVQVRDLNAAIKSYRQIADDSATPPAMAAQAMLGLGRCYKKLGNTAEANKAFQTVLTKHADQADAVREARQAMAESSRQQLPELMPPDMIGYVELTDPGQQLEQLAGAAGVDLGWLLAAGGPLGQGELPGQIFAEIKKARGAAIGIKKVDKQDPQGVLIIDTGDSAALMEELRKQVGTHGVIGEPMGNMTRVQIKDLTAVLGDRLALIGRPDDLVRQCAERCSGAKGPSLADTPLFGQLSGYRAGSAIFGFANLKEGVKALAAAAGNTKDYKGLDALVDLQSLEHLYIRFAVNKDTLSAEAALQLADTHNSVLYDLVRTPPITREFASRIPPSAWFALAAGLGDPQVQVSSAARTAVRHLTGLDIGRELFANVREAAICLMPLTESAIKAAEAAKIEPGAMSLGLIVGAQDAERSKALMIRLADLLAKIVQIDKPELQQGRGVTTVAGVEMIRYQFGNPGPSLCLAVKDNLVYAALDPAVLEQMMAPAADAARRDSQAARLMELAGGKPSKLAVLNLAPLAASPLSQKALNMDQDGVDFVRLVSRSAAVLTTDETPGQLRVRLLVGGLEQIGKQLPDLIARKSAQQAPAATGKP